MTRILVIYGTTHGHTEMIATAVTNTLTASGCDVDTVQAGTIDPGPEDYDGIVVAASVHGGRYQQSVELWLRGHIDALRGLPTAFLSVSLGVLQNDPKVRADLDGIVHRFIDPLGWQPTIVKPVAGALLYTKYNFLMRWIMKRIASKAGGDTDTSRDYDYTDWADLEAFARAFGERVAAAQSHGPASGKNVLAR